MSAAPLPALGTSHTHKEEEEEEGKHVQFVFPIASLEHGHAPGGQPLKER